MMSLVCLRNVEYRAFDGTWHRSIDRLDIPSGGRVRIIGGCGSGKTAVAFLMSGASATTFARGDVEFDGRLLRHWPRADLARRVSLVPADPSLIFSGIRSTLCAELELSLQILGLGSQTKSTIERAVETLSLHQLMHRDPFTLSGGEQVRAAVAIAIVKRPDLVVLDDVSSALDPEAIERLANVLVGLQAQGTTIVEMHTRTPEPILSSDQCVFLCDNKVVQGTFGSVQAEIKMLAPELLPVGESIASQVERRPSRTNDTTPVPSTSPLAVVPSPTPRLRSELPVLDSFALSVSDLYFQYPDGGFRIGPLSFNLPRGTAIAIVGPNGSGKTTVLRTLALLLVAQSGGIAATAPDLRTVRPPPAHRRHEWARHVLYAFQNPDDQIYLPTVRRELAETAIACGRSLHSHKKVDQIANELGLTDVLDRSPFDLPRPLRRLVTLGSGLVAGSPVLLLDEPSSSLDTRLKACLVASLAAYLGAGGSVITVSHDADFVRSICTSRITMVHGQISDRDIS
jgi:energy-coupling factor transporter ATP-binding protein EcfA2